MMSRKAVASLPGIKVNVQLAEQSWFRIGGPADYFLLAESTDAVHDAFAAAMSENIPVFILGGGSNILFDSKGFRGLVMKSEFRKFSISGDEVRVGAGYPLSAALRHSAEKNLGGWEGLFGIPGTVGGAVRGNAGAYGTEIGDFVKNVSFMDTCGEIHTADHAETSFSYRHSIFKESRVFIYETSFNLKEIDSVISAERMREIEAERMRKHPQKNTAGCFFKNPKEHGISAARLIEKAGLKGKRIGDAVVSDLHSNFIINLGRAESADVLSLAAYIKEKIFETSGILLEEEVEIVPENPAAVS
jgi:UDP-N-acetylmuramate dehydrogenase